MSPIIYTYWNGWMLMVENIMYLRSYFETHFKMLEDLGEGGEMSFTFAQSCITWVKNYNRKSYFHVSLLLILNYIYLRNLLALVLKKKKFKRRPLSERRTYLSCYYLFWSSCFSNEFILIPSPTFPMPLSACICITEE